MLVVLSPPGWEDDEDTKASVSRQRSRRHRLAEAVATEEPSVALSRMVLCGVCGLNGVNEGVSAGGWRAQAAAAAAIQRNSHVVENAPIQLLHGRHRVPE